MFVRSLIVLIVCASVARAQDWKPLFNGKDLSGWDTWLGSPGKGQKPVGLNVDPDKVYTVVEADGKKTHAAAPQKL